MEEMEALLGPVEEPVTMTRNATALSRFSEKLVLAFLRYHASEARVRHEDTEYDLDTLYQGLRRVCGKSAYRGVVRIHKQNGTLILLREVRRK
jgi:hypothetical protein